MKKTLPLICFLFCSITWGISQIRLTDFESFNLEIDDFSNGSDLSGGFDGNGIFLPNNFNENYNSWTGWSISTVIDTLTPGFTNQYACIAGAGAGESTHYATTFVSGESIIEVNNEFSALEISVTNSTYAFLSMLNGDSYAKKFGGESGDDPDFFLLTIKAYRHGQLQADSIDFYLADYRFDDNSLDFIIDEWTTIDLSVFTFIDSLSFTLSSSDVGAFGINTPAYFCVDNITVSDVALSQDNIHNVTTTLYPKPVIDKIYIESSTLKDGLLSIYNTQGQLIKRINNFQTTDPIDVSELYQGRYHIVIESQDYSRWIDTFIKN